VAAAPAAPAAPSVTPAAPVPAPVPASALTAQPGQVVELNLADPDKPAAGDASNRLSA
jgi:hypothetical protein